MNNGKHNEPAVQTRSGYSEAEVTGIYALGRRLLERGELHSAEPIFAGLSEVAPDFAPGWLGLTYLYAQRGESESALSAAQQAVRLQPDSVEAMLFLIAALLTVGDLNAAGTYLGEIQERVDRAEIRRSELIRFYRLQLARYSSRHR